MRTLNPLPYDDREYNKSIYYINETPLRIKDGKQGIYNNIVTIKDRFSEYSSVKEHLEDISDSPFDKDTDEELHTNLMSLYDSKEALKKSVTNISGIQCPYCGLNQKPYHVDHYLPNSKYPEFSIYPPNLIGVCSICNTVYKGSKIINDENERMFFNPYFDTFIELIPFLKCYINLVDDIYPEFTFYIDDVMEIFYPYEYKIIKNHFDNLKLYKSYNDNIVQEVFRRFKKEYVNPITREFYNTTLEDLKRDIQKKINGLHDKSINHWEKVFFETLLNHEECLNLIIEKKIDID